MTDRLIYVAMRNILRRRFEILNTPSTLKYILFTFLAQINKVYHFNVVI